MYKLKLRWLSLFVFLFLVSCKQGNVKVQSKANTISLFNGENLDKWSGDGRVWSVEKGCIVGRTSDEVKIDDNTFLIYESPFSDFELNLKYKIIGGNSGIQYRAEVLDEDNFVVKGYQADLEAGIQYSGILYEENGRGIMAMRGEQVVIDEKGGKKVEQFEKGEDIQTVINQDKWNNYKIIVKGSHLLHYINDVKTVDVIDNEETKRSDKGVIALQVHKGPNMVVYFKDITVKTTYNDNMP